MHVTVPLRWLVGTYGLAAPQRWRGPAASHGVTLLHVPRRGSAVHRSPRAATAVVLRGASRSRELLVGVLRNSRLAASEGARQPLPQRWHSSRRRTAQPNPRSEAPCTRRWVGATPPHRCHSGGSAGSVWHMGLSGRLPLSPPRGIQGPGSSSCRHCGGTARHGRRHSGGTTTALLPEVDPPAPPAAAFP